MVKNVARTTMDALLKLPEKREKIDTKKDHITVQSAFFLMIGIGNDV